MLVPPQDSIQFFEFVHELQQVTSLNYPPNFLNIQGKSIVTTISADRYGIT